MNTGHKISRKRRNPMDWLRKVNNDNELQQLDACSTNDLVS